MIIRMKSGEMMTANGSVLLDYLGVKQDASGVHRVTGDVELISAVPFQLATDGETERGFAWVLSTFDLDRYGERVDPNGWEFQRFLLNPVVEWAHRYDIPAIGKIEGIAVDADGLHGVVCFNGKEFDPFGWSIGERVKAGVIRAGSVGFRVMEIEIPSKEDAPNGGKDGTALIFRKQELLEFSICNVPANPFALAKGLGNGDWGIENKNSGVTASPFWGSFINNL